MPSSSVDSHRPWPRPERPWVMRMRWSELLFAHWPIDAEPVREKLPRGLELDLFDGRAWLGVIPFVMSGVRARLLPPIPTATKFCELNVRTYVVCDGKPGVWFFSLDAESSLAVFGARATFHLPYFKAEMRCGVVRGEVTYTSSRAKPSTGPADFRARYRAVSEPRTAARGSLEHWLVERYCLYAAAGERVWRGDIAHAPWRLSDARAEIELNTMASAAGLALPAREPLLHLAATQDVVAWMPERAR